MLEIVGLTKSFSGFVAVSNVSLTVETQQITAVIGLRFFADRAAKKWPLWGSLKLG